MPSSASTLLYSPLERQLAREKLNNWIGAPRRANDRERAIDTFLGALAGAAPEEDLDRELKHPELQSLLRGWLRADTRFGRERCAARELLSSSKGAKLPRGSRRYLEELGDSVVGVHEVLATDPGQGVTLRRLPWGQEIEVSERRGSVRLAPGDLLAARLLPGGRGEPVLEAVVMLPGDVDEAHERLERFFATLADASGVAEAEAAAPSAAAAEDDFRFAASKLLAPYLARWWIEGHVGAATQRRLVPALRNGEVLEPGVSEYLLDGRAPAADRLDEIPGMEQTGPHERTLYDRVEGGWIVVGSVHTEIGGQRPAHLFLDAPGRESMARLRQAVRKVFGRAMRHVHTSYQEPRWVEPGPGAQVEAVERPVDLAELGIDPAAPDSAALLQQARRQRHLVRWPDQLVAALGGATPRAAVQDAELRPLVIRLLRDWEQHDERRCAADARALPLDFAPVWRLLGLDRPLERPGDQG